MEKDYQRAEFFRTLRKNKNLTQNQVAEILSLSDKTISKWEVGSSLPDINIIKKVATLYSVTVDELLEGKYNTQANTIQTTNDTYIKISLIDYSNKFIWCSAIFIVSIVLGVVLLSLNSNLAAIIGLIILVNGTIVPILLMHTNYSKISKTNDGDTSEYKKILDNYYLLMNLFLFISSTFVIVCNYSNETVTYTWWYPLSTVIGIFGGINFIRLLKTAKWPNYRQYTHILITILFFILIIFGTQVILIYKPSEFSFDVLFYMITYDLISNLNPYCSGVFIISFLISTLVSLYSIWKKKKYLTSYILLTISYVTFFISLIITNFIDITISVGLMPTSIAILTIPIIAYGIFASLKQID